jgi:hypothetical protein
MHVRSLLVLLANNMTCNVFVFRRGPSIISQDIAAEDGRQVSFFSLGSNGQQQVHADVCT